MLLTRLSVSYGYLVTLIASASAQTDSPSSSESTVITTATATAQATDLATSTGESSSSNTVSGAAPTGSETATATGTATTNTTGAAFTTSVGLSLDELWNIWVGPVEVYSINTTVEATPVPSAELIPPPPLNYPSFPTGAVNPAVAKNESWTFPPDFWWGVASAAYQVEGAAKDEGRGPTIWDVFTHRVKGYTLANQTGDIANNQYYYYRQDIARIAALGVPSYSFSIAWSRIFPFGRGQVNEEGLAHYDDVINTCLEYGVQPMITLYHWDLPLYLQNLYGGWLSEDIVEDFAAYAQVVFERYHDRVSHFFTFNEPIVFCNTYPQPVGYFRPTDIPPKQQPFYCGQSVLLANARAYEIGKSINESLTISVKHNGGYKIPLTNSSADAVAVQRAWDFNEGWFSNPLFIDGDYPRYLKEYTSTFLRPFNDSERNSIVNSSDIYAHDAYTSQFYMAPDGGIDACTSNDTNPLFPTCANSTYAYPEEDGGWNIGYAADPLTPWLHKAADWLPAFLQYIQDTWHPRGGIAVTEFGFAEPFEAQKTILADIRTDLGRSRYYREYMEAILIAISQGVDVVGCLAWSLVDNLEWAQGYEPKFGMQYVNFTTQQRYYKASFFEYVNVFQVYLNGTQGSSGSGNATMRV